MNKEELLKRIKALADKGIDGEQENAKELLQRLMLKYNIDEKDLSDDVVEEHIIRFKTELEKKLIMQIIYAVQGDNYNFWTYKYGIKQVGYTSTAAEHLEIEAMYEFYSHHLQKDLEIFYSAFLKKNDIYPSSDKITKTLDVNKLSEEEKEILARADVMSMTLEKHNMRKSLEYKESVNE